MSTIIQVNGSPVAATAPGQRTLLINQSVLATIYLDTFRNVTISSTPLPPLASIIVTGEDGEQWFASTCGTSTALLSATPNVEIWNPGIPPLMTATLISQASGTHTLFKFPVDGRIWNAQVSAVMISNSSFTGGSQLTGAAILDGTNNVVLTACEVGIAGPSQLCVSNNAIDLRGIPVPAGYSFALDVASPGGDPANTTTRATGILGYSLP